MKQLYITPKYEKYKNEVIGHFFFAMIEKDSQPMLYPATRKKTQIKIVSVLKDIERVPS